MTIADYCILVIAILPYIMAAIAKSGAVGFDNAEPRDMSVFTGKSRRAWNAHINSFEALPFFAAGVILAEYRGAAQTWVDILALLFVIIRFVYVYLYLENKAQLRSSVFSLGLLVTIALFFLPLFSR
jgi:uncharacterized MAPEG superfamily protein